MMTLPDTYSLEEKNELERQFNVLLQCWKSRKNEQDVALVTEAYLLAANAHKDARRRSGEPYMYHPLAVATIIAGEMGMGRTSIICALLHDVVEDTDYTLYYIPSAGIRSARPKVSRRFTSKRALPLRRYYTAAGRKTAFVPLLKTFPASWRLPLPRQER